MVLEEGFAWNGQTFGSLSQIAKGDDRDQLERPPLLWPSSGKDFRSRGGHGSAKEQKWDRLCSANGASAEDAPKDQTIRRSLRCAVYTRVSTEHGLEQEFNSLDNQREASEATSRARLTRAGG